MLPTKENTLLLVLALIQFTCVLDFMVMMPLSTILLDEFKITGTEFGILVASYSLSGGVAGILSSFFIDKFDRKKAIFITYLLFLLGTIVCGFSTGFNSMLFSRIITGMFSGILSALTFSTIADVFEYKRRGLAMGKVMTGIGAAAVVGVPLGNYIAVEFSWQTPFYAIAALGLIILIAIYALIPALNQHLNSLKIGGFEAFKALIQSKNRLLGLLLMTLLMFGSFTIIPFIPEFMVHNLGTSQLEVSYIYLFGGLGSIVMLLLVGKLSDKFGSPTIYLILTLLTAPAIYFVTNLESGGLAYILIFTTLLFTISGSRNVPANTLITETAEPHQRAGYMSIVVAVQQIAGGLAALLGSVLVQTNLNQEILNFDTIGWFTIIASLLCVPLVFIIRPSSTKIAET